MNRLILLLLFLSKLSIAQNFNSKASEFVVNLKTLDAITKNFQENRTLFDEKNYMNIKLYKALILNDYIMNSHENSSFSNLFCEENNENLIKLLKWKISISLIESNIDFNCKDKLVSYASLMDDYFLDSDYVDAYIEFYKINETNKNKDLIEMWSLLNSNLYKTPDIEIAELLISVQHEIYVKTGKRFGEWNVSVIAAKYGSYKGILNLTNMLEKKSIEHEFFLKVISLWPTE
jgi:hypothetical protein